MVWKDIIWEALSEGPLGALRLGEHAITAPLDADQLAQGLPPLFHAAFHAWARLPTPQPTQPTEIEHEAVVGQPLGFNPAARAG